MALIKRKEQVSYDFDPLFEGTAVMSFQYQSQADEYVSKLVKGDFPAEAIAIRGTDLYRIEKVTGDINYAKEALKGIKQGFYYAIGFGVVFGFLDGYSQALLTLALEIGIGYGCFMVIVEVFDAWLDSKSKNYESFTELVAGRYEVLVNPDLENQVHDAFIKGALGAKPEA